VDDACQLGRSLYRSKSDDDRNIGFHNRRDHYKHQCTENIVIPVDIEVVINVNDGNTGRS
jgi:hypothetical protein